MILAGPGSLHLLHLVTRLGEAGILLPTAILPAGAMLSRSDGRPMAMWWMCLLGAAVLLTITSKIAFIGSGIGSAELDFTGISGHAMFAAAVYPLLLGTLASGASHRARCVTMIAGAGLAILVGVSRIVVGAHSASEVIARLFVGGTVSAVALAFVHLPRAWLGPLIPSVVVCWLAAMPLHASASQTLAMVARVSLMLSGRSAPYTRRDLHREHQRRLIPPYKALARVALAAADATVCGQGIDRSSA